MASLKKNLCTHIAIPPSSVRAKLHMCWACVSDLPWHHGGTARSGAVSVISPWTQSFSSCWKKNAWAISREEAHSVMQVYIEQLLYQRSWKNNFFKHHCTISYFLSKSSTYFSYKKVDNVLTLYIAYKHTQKKPGGLTPEPGIPNLLCWILILKLWFKVSSNKNYAPAKAGNKILALPFLSCSPWLQAYLLCHKETHNRMRSNNKWKQYISPILLLPKTTLTSNFSP